MPGILCRLDNIVAIHADAPSSLILKWIDLGNPEHTTKVPFMMRVVMIWVLGLEFSFEAIMRQEAIFFQGQMPDMLRENSLQIVECLACEIVDYGDPCCFVCCGCTTNMQRYLIFEDLAPRCDGYTTPFVSKVCDCCLGMLARPSRTYPLWLIAVDLH